MFRDTTNSKIDPALFGSGSIMVAGHDKYLVCSAGTPKYVCLLNLNTFKLESGTIPCVDVNFLSQDEVRELGRLVGCTLSDFDFDSKGLKVK
jgi:hypothetical protein